MTLLESSSPETLKAVIYSLTILDIIIVGLRFYTRQSLGQRLKSDDWFAFGALVFVIALAVYVLIGIHERWVGYRVPADFTGEVFDPTVSGSLQHFYVWCVLFFPTLWLIKSSFLLYYRRIFVIDGRDFRDWTNIALIFALALVAVWTLAFGLPWVFVCTPVQGFWRFPYATDVGPCVDTWKLQRAIGISDFLVDVFILLLPVPMVWRLRLATSRKFAVIAVFFLGFLAVAASLMRMIRVIWASALPADTTVDGFLQNSTILFWGMIEANLALLAACLPTLRGFFRTHAVNTFLKSYRSKFSLRSSRYTISRGQDSLPFAHSPPTPAGEQKPDERRRIYPQDISLTTMDSVATSNMGYVHRQADLGRIDERRLE